MEREAKQLFETVKAICASRYVRDYVIGLTATPTRRRYAYRQAEALRFKHFIILRSELNATRAKALEEALQKLCKPDPRYHKTMRHTSYRGSLGGTEHVGPVYSVYMTWP